MCIPLIFSAATISGSRGLCKSEYINGTIVRPLAHNIRAFPIRYMYRSQFATTNKRKDETNVTNE